MNNIRSPERDLWMTVLATAIDDALTPQKWKTVNGERRNPRRDDRDYFRDNTRDFRIVCGLAGYDSSYVREKVIPEIHLVEWEEYWRELLAEFMEGWKKELDL